MEIYRLRTKLTQLTTTPPTTTVTATDITSAATTNTSTLDTNTPDTNTPDTNTCIRSDSPNSLDSLFNDDDDDVPNFTVHVADMTVIVRQQMME